MGAAGAGVGAGAEIGGGVTFSTLGLGCVTTALGASFLGANTSATFFSRTAGAVGAAETGVTGTGLAATAGKAAGSTDVAGVEPAKGTELTGTAGAVTGLTSEVSNVAGVRP